MSVSLYYTDTNILMQFALCEVLVPVQPRGSGKIILCGTICTYCPGLDSNKPGYQG